MTVLLASAVGKERSSSRTREEVSKTSHEPLCVQQHSQLPNLPIMLRGGLHSRLLGLSMGALLLGVVVMRVGGVEDRREGRSTAVPGGAVVDG